MEITIFDELSLRGEALERATYQEEAREFEEGNVDALVPDVVAGADGGGDGGGAAGGGGGGQPQAMELTEAEAAEFEEIWDQSMTPPGDSPVVRVDMEVRSKSVNL